MTDPQTAINANSDIISLLNGITQLSHFNTNNSFKSACNLPSGLKLTGNMFSTFINSTYNTHHSSNNILYNVKNERNRVESYMNNFNPTILKDDNGDIYNNLLLSNGFKSYMDYKYLNHYINEMNKSDKK